MISSISAGQNATELITCTSHDTDAYTKEVTLSFIVPEKDFIYKDFITCSIDEPKASLSPWKANKPSVAHFDPSFKETKHVFNEHFDICMTITRQTIIHDHLFLYCSYYRQSEKKINHALFPLIFTITQPTTITLENNTEFIDNNDLPIKISKKTTYLERYLLSCVSCMHIIVTSLRTDHRKYCALLIFLIMVLIAFYSFFKKELRKQVRIKELLQIIITTLTLINITYLLFFLRTTGITFVTGATTCVYAVCGIFYTKKSTFVRSKNLRTVCTFLGILCICSALLLAFKTIQYADEQFRLW